MTETRGRYTLTTDPARIDFEAVHRHLSQETYWAENMPAETLRRAIAHSLCFSILEDERKQVAFGRVITDRATYAYLSDVVVISEARGQGHSKWMMEAVMRHPDLQGLRRFALLTKDAHTLYERFGFAPSEHPEWYLEIVNRDVYKR
jgi:N-acetylglutamate synthase-like GNAT family acetyltransferase